MSPTTTDSAQTAFSVPAPPALRASDAEREETVALLHHALGEGRLDLAETEVRVAAAYAARHRDELPPLLADLPGAGPQHATSAAPSLTDLWVSAVWRARLLLLGAAGGERPSPRQLRSAAVVCLVAAFWVLTCAVLGAAVVGP